MSEVSHIQIPGFEILSTLGMGGMGTVYKARQLSLDRLVAIKTLPPALADDEESIKLLRHEARVEATLKHPNIVQVYEAGHVNEVHYFVMEYVEGRSISVLLQKTGRLPESDVLALAEVIAHALDHAWTRGGIIHGDLKPGNLLLDTDGTVKLGDFLGLTLTDTDHATPYRDHILGTLNYMSPEQAIGSRSLDVRSDIYSLGALLYHLVSGRLPFADAGEGLEPEEVILNTQLDDVSLVADVGIEMAGLIEKLMIRDLARRPKSWAHVLTDLARVRHGELPAGPPVMPGVSAMSRSPARTAELAVRPSPPTHATTAAIATAPQGGLRSIFQPIILAAMLLVLVLFFLIPPRPVPEPIMLVADEPAVEAPPVFPEASKEETRPTEAVSTPTPVPTAPEWPAAVVKEDPAPEPAVDPEVEARRAARAAGLSAYTRLMYPALSLIGKRDYEAATLRIANWLTKNPDHVYAPEVRTHAERIERVSALLEMLEARDFMLRNVTLNTGSHEGTVAGIADGQLNLKLSGVGDQSPVISLPLLQLSTENMGQLIEAIDSDDADVNGVVWKIAEQDDPFAISGQLSSLPADTAEELRKWQDDWQGITANYAAYRALIGVAKTLKSGEGREAEVALQLAAIEHRDSEVFSLQVQDLERLRAAVAEAVKESSDESSTPPTTVRQQPGSPAGREMRPTPTAPPKAQDYVLHQKQVSSISVDDLRYWMSEYNGEVIQLSFNRRGDITAQDDGSFVTTLYGHDDAIQAHFAASGRRWVAAAPATHRPKASKVYAVVDGRANSVKLVGHLRKDLPGKREAASW